MVLKGCRHGHIEGYPVGCTFADRDECKEAGVHGKPREGIFWRPLRPAYAIVLNGEYEYDEDGGDEIIYNGVGGRKNKKEQNQSQVWRGANYAMKLAHEWNKPVRVIRGFKLKSPYAPDKGYRYDGLYSVQKVHTSRAQEKNKHTDENYKLCMFKLQRVRDQDPAPWLKNTPSGSGSTNTDTTTVAVSSPSNTTTSRRPRVNAIGNRLFQKSLPNFKKIRPKEPETNARTVN